MGATIGSSKVERRAAFTRKGVGPPDYEIDDCLQPLVQYFFEVGPTYGDQVIPWHEIEAWARKSGTEATPFVCEAIRMMSAEYLSMSQKARDENCPDPTKPPPSGRQARPEQAEDGGPQKPAPRKLGRKR